MEFGADQSLFDMLRGRWRLTRKIADRAAGLNGRFEGVAIFLTTAAPLSLDYRETGTLSFGPFEHAAERQYRWRFRAPDRASVFFDDGRFFHTLRPMNGIAEVHHDCAPDRYEGRYVFEAPDRWTQAWRVAGPRKDYDMESLFERDA